MNISKDPHSHYEPGQPRITKLHWLFSLDFAAKRLHGMCHYTFDEEGETFLDGRHLEVIRVYGTKGDIEHTYESGSDLLGGRLSFLVPQDCIVMVEYKTDPEAHGIQWMSADVAGGQPFVYTQGEAINARTYIPCQDTPSVKFTFSAEAAVPKALRGLVAAANHVERKEGDETAVEAWDMPYPIPSYLIAFAVGDLQRRELSSRSAVWAQSHMVHRAADEFRDIPELMKAGEALFGAYPFGRYDVLVMPDAFPYGGMENPCLSFLTPALVAGDRSGISTVAHELAHSWTGNLITNADWSSFWLNEGWTVWAEDRIVEAVFGRDAAMLGRKLLEREFEEDLAYFRRRDEMKYTALAPEVSYINPDDVFSRVPYFKGAQFLTLIEETVGRERFDAFALSYISAYRYESIDTSTFLDFFRAELGDDVFDAVGAHQWVYQSGYPKNAPAIVSSLVDDVQEMVDMHFVPPLDTSWTKPQWQLYLELLPEKEAPEFLLNLNSAWNLGSEQNIEVRWSFLVRAVKAGLYESFAEEVEGFLRSQGRMKYLKPLYAALAATPDGRELAERIFLESRSTYHPVAVSAVQQVLAA